MDFPDWTIKPTTSEAQEFWQYLFVRHHKEIAASGKAKLADIPKGWLEVDEARALQNLKVMFRVI